MHGCTEIITIWNRRLDRLTKKHEYIRVLMPVLCSFRSRRERAYTASAAHRASKFSVIIPFTDKYLHSKEWEKLDEERRRGYFTINVGDLIAVGEHYDEISGVSPNTASELRERLLPNSYFVKGFANCTNVPRGKHFKVWGD